MVRIEEDKIYYMVPKVDIKSENNWGTLEERVYVIDNNKLEYTILKSYTINSMTGQLC